MPGCTSWSTCPRGRLVVASRHRCWSSWAGLVRCSARAEEALLDLARSHDARALKRLGRHVEHALDPDAADRRLGVHLEREERAAARATFLEVHDNGDGTHGGRFRFSDFHAAALA